MSFALKSSVILSIAWIATLLLRRQSAAIRHVIWLAAAGALLSLPLLRLCLPAFSIPVPTPGIIAVLTTSSTGNTPAAHSVAIPASGQARPQPVRRHFQWRLALILLWAIGSAVALARMLMAFAGLWRARRSTTPSPHRALAAELAAQLGIHRPVDVLEAAADTMPMTFGIIRSGIFLPSGADQWSRERLRVVLLHELAHVRRHDVAAHFVSQLALALHWWNPLAHVAWRESLKERERAADDLVLQAGARPSEYAGHLLEVARSLRMPGSFGALAMARRSQLEGRLTAILDSRARRGHASRAFALAVTALAIAVVLPLAAVRAQERTSLPSDVDATIREATAQHNPAMLDAAAAAFEAARQYDTARKLYESAAALRSEASGPNSADYGIALLKLGDLEQHRNRRTEAGAFYTQAIQTLGERPEAAPALTFLGVAALIDKNIAQATGRFDEARRLGGTGATAATMWMGVARERDQKPAEAEELYRSALAAEPADSAEAAITATVLANLLNSQGRHDEATELLDRAAAIQKAHSQPGVVRPGVFRIGPGLSAPKVLSKVEPAYSDEARVAKYQGTVVVSVEVGADGLAHNTQVVKGMGLGLDEQALTAIEQWRFEPGMKDGAPVNVLATIEVNFRLL
jgi:TonB family protein